MLRHAGGPGDAVSARRDAGDREAAWAGAILLFAVLAAAGVAGGYRHHRSAAPPALALGGAALVGYALYGSYSLAIELAGFALLAAAVYADFRLRRRGEV